MMVLRFNIQYSATQSVQNFPPLRCPVCRYGCVKHQVRHDIAGPYQGVINHVLLASLGKDTITVCRYFYVSHIYGTRPLYKAGYKIHLPRLGICAQIRPYSGRSWDGACVYTKTQMTVSLQVGRWPGFGSESQSGPECAYCPVTLQIDF